MAKATTSDPGGKAEASPKSFDLTRIRMVEASFLDCTIRSERAPVVPAESQQFQITRLLSVPNFDMAVQQVFYALELHVQGINGYDEPTGTVGEFRLYFAFEVANILEYSTTSESRDEPFPIADLLIMLGGVAYSTMRGLLFGKTAGTPLSGFALPLRSPKDLFFESLNLREAEAKPEKLKKSVPAKRKLKAE